MDMKKSIVIIIAILVIGLSSCNLPVSVPIPTAVNLESTLAILAASTLTAAVSDTPAFTATPSETPVPPASPTPSMTPTITPTFTPTVPMVSVSANTNCRTGPGTVYDLVAILLIGQTAEVIGRDAVGQYWVIRDPSHPANSCWLWGNYATVTGNWSALPVVAAPPTPTPAPGFAVAYLTTVSCGGQYGFRFQANNTGGITWESIRIVVTDNTTATTNTHTLDAFRSYNGCAVESSEQDLAPGEGAVVANINPGQFGYNPAGHSITAAFTLCSADGLAGTCVSQTINFTP